MMMMPDNATQHAREQLEFLSAIKDLVDEEYVAEKTREIVESTLSQLGQGTQTPHEPYESEALSDPRPCETPKDKCAAKKSPLTVTTFLTDKGVPYERVCCIRPTFGRMLTQVYEEYFGDKPRDCDYISSNRIYVYSEEDRWLFEKVWEEKILPILDENFFFVDKKRVSKAVPA